MNLYSLILMKTIFGPNLLISFSIKQKENFWDFKNDNKNDTLQLLKSSASVC